MIHSAIPDSQQPISTYVESFLKRNLILFPHATFVCVCVCDFSCCFGTLLQVPHLDIVFAFQTNHCILEATRSLKSQRSPRILEPSQSTPGVCHLDTLILKVYSRDQPK